MAKSHDESESNRRKTDIGRGLCWHSPHDHRFALEITGYEFPEMEDGYDANWLNIHVAAANEDGSWERDVPCVLTWELPWIARWLSHVVDGVMEDESYSGLEDDLAFRFIAASESEARFAVVLRGGLSRDAGEFSLINVALSRNELAAAVDYFNHAIEAFPPRGLQGELGMTLAGPRLLRGE